MAATETGLHHRSYNGELRIWQTKAQWVRLGLLVLVMIALPWVLDNYWLSLVNTALIAVVGAIGLNILVGYTGQISLGQGGFLAVGAYTSVILADRAELPVPVSIISAVVVTAAVGTFFGLPGLRLKGLYLAIATLASQQIIMFIVRRWSWLTEGAGFVDVARLEIPLIGFKIERATFEQQWYAILLVIAIIATLAAVNLFRSGLGRSFMAVRDQDIAAAAIGVNVTRAKLTAFAVSSGFVGLAGALMAHYTEIISWERFTLDVSILYLAMIIVGGLGSVAGSIYGAFFMTFLPVIVRTIAESLSGVLPILSQNVAAFQNAMFGLVIIIFLIVEPRGLNRLWTRVKDYFGFWPFRY